MFCMTKCTQIFSPLRCEQCTSLNDDSEYVRNRAHNYCVVEAEDLSVDCALSVRNRAL